MRSQVRGALRPGARVDLHGRGVHTWAQGRQTADLETRGVETGGPEARAGRRQEFRAVDDDEPAGEAGHRRGDQGVHKLLAQGLAAAGLPVRPSHNHKLQHRPVLVETHMVQKTGQVRNSVFKVIKYKE